MASDSSRSGALLLEARNSAQALQSVIQDQGQIIDRDNVFQDALKCLAELHMSTESRDCNEVQELNSSIVALLTRTEGKPLDGTRKVHDDSVAKLLKIHGTPRTSDASSMLDALMFIFSRTLDDSGNLAVDPKANLSLLYESGDFQLPRDSTLGGSFEALDFQDFKKHDTIAKAPNTAVAILFCFMENHNKLAIELRKQDELQGDEEQIFNAARTINCLQFQNVIIEDVLHGLTLPLVDPWAKLDIDTSNDKQASRDDEARLLYEMFTFESPGGVPSPPPHEVIHNALHESTKIYEIYKNPHCDGILAWLKDRSIVTFNEYRKFLGLNPLSDFNHWTENPKVIESYDSMDSVELLPGLYFERSFPGSGFNLGYTHTYALFIDIVKILRQDPIRKEMKEDQLKKWGFEPVKPFQTEDGSKPRRQLSKLLLDHLPLLSSSDSAHIDFPLSLLPPQKNKKTGHRDDPPDNRPLELTSMDVIKKVFNDPVQFNTLYGDALSDLTKGYGFMLGFDNDPSDETSHHDLDVYMTCYALMPDVRAFKEYSTYFKEHVYKRLKKKVDSANGTKASLTYVDLATEVIIPVCTQWACEKIYGLELSKDESLEKELEDHFKNFLNIFGVVFNKGPVDKQKAKETSEALSRVIEDRIKRAKAEIHKKAEGWSEFFTRVLLEYAIGRPLPASTNYSFLDQLIKANHSTIGRFPLVASLKSMKPFLEPLPDDKAFTRKIGKERLEQARLASNTLAFAVVAAVNYAQACLYVLDYYLTNPDRLKELQGKHEQDHAEFMKYCHEALRLNQPLFLSRRANLGEGKDMDLSGMKVKHNDIVYANLWTVHQTLPKEEFDVGKEGKMHSLYGVGFHRCPASKFVKETMPEFLRPILELQSLAFRPDFEREIKDESLPCRSGIQGQEANLFQRKYIVGASDQPYPWTLPVEFKTASFKVVEEKKPFGHDTLQMKAIEGSGAAILILLLTYLFGFMNSVSNIIPDVNLLKDNLNITQFKPPSELVCSLPTNIVQKWAINTFFPDANGRPAPVEYTLNYKTPHRLTLVDIDRRDMMMAVHVDGVLQGQTTDFIFDKNMDCGEDLGACLSLKYSGGVVIVPPGNHTVKIAWVGKEYIPGTYDMDWGTEYSRRFKYRIEGCS